MKMDSLLKVKEEYDQFYYNDSSCIDIKHEPIEEHVMSSMECPTETVHAKDEPHDDSPVSSKCFNFLCYRTNINLVL